MISRILVFLILVMFTVPFANCQAQEMDDLKEWNNQIRREKLDLVLPQAMKKNNIDMWIHVMRIAIPDPFGAEELGSTSGVFIFTDRGGDRIERAVLGRRWGASQRERGGVEMLVEKYGVYDIIHDPVFVQQPVVIPMTEYDYRFKGLREFVEARNPKRIAINYRENLGTWATSPRANDGISHIDYLLLTKELGENYADRLVSSEYVMMDYQITPVPMDTTATPDRADGKSPDSRMIIEYTIEDAQAEIPPIIKNIVVYQPEIGAVQLTYTNPDSGEKRTVDEMDEEFEKIEKGLETTQWVTDPDPMRKQIQIAINRLDEQKRRAKTIGEGRYKPILFVVAICIKDAEQACDMLNTDFKLNTLLVTEKSD